MSDLLVRPNPVVNRTRQFMVSTWRTSIRRADYLTRWTVNAVDNGERPIVGVVWLRTGTPSRRRAR
jgi:hypothetical protein